MVTGFNLDNVNSEFHDAYKDYIDAVSEIAIAAPYFKPVRKNKNPGGQMHNAVELRREQGITRSAAGQGASTAMNEAVQMYIGDAQVRGAQLAGRAEVTYEEISKGESGNVYMEPMLVRVNSLKRSLESHLEQDLLYGGTARAVIAQSAYSNVSSTETQLTVANAEFAPGLLQPFEGAEYNFFDSSGSGSLVSSGSDAVFSISTVDTTNRTFNVTGTATGITALEAALDSGAVGAFPRGGKNSSGTQQEMTGAYTILNNSGTLFNIDAGTYSLWKATTYAARGRLTFDVVNQAVARVVGRVLRQKSFTLFCNPNGWADLLSDMHAQRVFDERTGVAKLEAGSKKLEFFSQNNDKITILSHPMVKEGHAFLFMDEDGIRVGSTFDWFNLPGVSEGGRIWENLPDDLGIQVRGYTVQALLLQQPACHCLITDIKNSGS